MTVAPPNEWPIMPAVLRSRRPLNWLKSRLTPNKFPTGPPLLSNPNKSRALLASTERCFTYTQYNCTMHNACMHTNTRNNSFDYNCTIGLLTLETTIIILKPAHACTSCYIHECTMYKGQLTLNWLRLIGCNDYVYFDDHACMHLFRASTCSYIIATMHACSRNFR